MPPWLGSNQNKTIPEATPVATKAEAKSQCNSVPGFVIVD
jgi:hypothetical protein